MYGHQVLLLKNTKRLLTALELQTLSLEVRSPNPNLDGAFQAAVKHRVSALMTVDPMPVQSLPKGDCGLAIKNRLPSMFESSNYVEAGGLVSYGTDDAANLPTRRCFVDNILKGAKPADLPGGAADEV